MERILDDRLGCVLGSDGATITELNDRARALFPRLAPGDPLPGGLTGPEGEDWEGLVPLDGRMYQVRCVRDGAGYLYTVQPREQQGLTEGQLDGALYQLRTLMGEFHRELAPVVGEDRGALTLTGKEQFARSYDRMLRLMDQLDFLRDAQGGLLRPGEEDVDLAWLCGEVALECDGLLREVGIRVVTAPAAARPLVRGDHERLRNGVLELVSNCAKRLSKGGTITLSCTQKGSRGVLCVTDDGPAPTQRQRLGLSVRGAMPLIPMPGQGAGLGLSVAEQAAVLHGGALLFSTGDGAPRAYLTLPLVKRGAAVTLRCPKVERNAGRNPYIIALSDVLPGSIVREDWKE